MAILLQALLLVMGMVHYSHGQTMLDCSMRPFCEDRNLTKGYINALSSDSNNFAQFDCFMTIPLRIVQITWYYQRFDEDSKDPGELNKIFSNVHGSDMFTTSVAILDLSNFTYGPVRSRLQIRHVTGDYEGTYSCVQASDDVKNRQYNACLFVLGQGVFESCPDSLTGCQPSKQTVKTGDSAELDVRVVFRGGGGCAHQRVSRLTVKKDTEVVYSCVNQDSEDQCDSAQYPKFKVVSGENCKVDCKYNFDLQLLDFGKSDVGEYTAEVVLENVGNITGRTIVRKFLLEQGSRRFGSTDLSGTTEFKADERASLYGGVFLCSVVLPTISLIVLTLVAWLLIIKLILVVRKRRPTPTRGGFHVKNAYGILFDHEVDNCEHVEKGSLTTDGYEPAKASSSNN